MDIHTFIEDEHIKTTGIIIGTLFFVGNLIEFVYSNYKKKNFYTLDALVINFSLAFLQQLTDVFNKVVFFLGFYFVQQHYSIQKLLGFQAIPIDFPLSLNSIFPFISINWYMLFIWLFILIIADFCQYWLHRLSHEVNIMWAGHIVHHSMEEYNYAVALRQSFIESVYTWIFYLPLAFFGIPWQLFIMAYAISLIWQFFVHTRLINKLGILEYILMTPSHHRVHHGKNPQYIDKNYGALFIFWDKLFGTFEPEVETVDYGITVPLQTQHPIWVNVHHHVHIFKMANKTKSFSNRMKIIFGKPEFVPNDLVNAYNHLKQLKKPIIKALPAIKNFYIFLNMLLTALSGFILVNYYQESKDLFLFLPLAFCIAASFSINIGLLESKEWANYAEVLKLMLILLAGLWVTNFSMHKIIGYIMIAAALLMLVYTWIIAKQYRQQISILQK